MSSPENKATLNSLQVLRGLAALGVFASHLVLKGARFGPAIFPHGSGLGVFGVDIFFVISGFIMVRSTVERGSGLRAAGGLLLQRFGRIYPPYWIVLGLCVAVEALFPGAITNGPRASLTASILLEPSAFVPVLRSAWTLVHEVYFYVAFAVLMLVPRRWMAQGLLAWALAVAATELFLGHRHSPLYALLAHPLTLEFILGAALALVKPGQDERRFFLGWGAGAALAASLGVFVVGACIYTRFAPAFGVAEAARVLLVGLPAALLVHVVTRSDGTHRWTPPRALLWLGDRSYSLYLVNLPCSAITATAVAHLMGLGVLAAWAYALIAILVVGFASVALHSGIERPSIAIFRTLAKRLTAHARPAATETLVTIAP